MEYGIDNAVNGALEDAQSLNKRGLLVKAAELPEEETDIESIEMIASNFSQEPVKGHSSDEVEQKILECLAQAYPQLVG